MKCWKNKKGFKELEEIWNEKQHLSFQFRFVTQFTEKCARFAFQNKQQTYFQKYTS